MTKNLKNLSSVGLLGESEYFRLLLIYVMDLSHKSSKFDFLNNLCASKLISDDLKNIYTDFGEDLNVFVNLNYYELVSLSMLRNLAKSIDYDYDRIQTKLLDIGLPKSSNLVRILEEFDKDEVSEYFDEYCFIELSYQHIKQYSKQTYETEEKIIKIHEAVSRGLFRESLLVKRIEKNFL